MTLQQRPEMHRPLLPHLLPHPLALDSRFELLLLLKSPITLEHRLELQRALFPHSLLLLLALDSRLKQSSAVASRTGGCSVFKNASGTKSRSDDDDRRPPGAADACGVGGVNGVENGRGDDPELDDDGVNGDGSRKYSTAESDTAGMRPAYGGDTVAPWPCPCPCACAPYGGWWFG